MEFVHRMLNLEESGELIKMVTELEETMNESETTAMCMLIEAIPRHEKKLEIKRPKGKPHNVGPRVRKIKLSKEHESAQQGRGKPTKAKKQKKQATGRNDQAKAKAKASGASASGGEPKEMVKKTDMAKQEFIDDQGNVYRYVGTVDPQEEGLQNSQRDNEEGSNEDYYDDEEFQANLIAVMKDDSVLATEPTTKELVELNYVNEHHEQYFQPTLPSEEFSGVMVYNNGVPTQTYNDTEMDPQLMDTLFEFRNRQNNDANLLHLTMKELQTTIPIIDPSMVNTNTNMKGTHNELYGYNQPPFPVQQQQQQQQMVGANGMNAFLIDTANRINHTETSLAAHCFKPPEDHAEFSGVIVYDHGQEIETYENDSYFNPNSQGGKPTVHVERTIALATLNEKDKKNETNEGYFSREVMDQHVLPAYMNDVMEMNAGVVPGSPFEHGENETNEGYFSREVMDQHVLPAYMNDVMVMGEEEEEEEEDDPYYGPFG